VKYQALFAFVLTFAACAKHEPAPAETSAPPTSAPAPASATAVASAASAAPAASVEVPVEEDFEQEATDAVTAHTLDAQLDALEKEIKAN